MQIFAPLIWKGWGIGKILAGGADMFRNKNSGFIVHFCAR